MHKKITTMFLILLILLSIGTLGYNIIEKRSILDSLYVTVVTLATVGYGDITPATPAGKIFTIFLILFGMSVLLYTVSTITSFFIEGELKQLFRRKKMQNKISLLKNHYIVCGAGRTGNHIIAELKKTKRDFVIIEKSNDTIQQFEDCLYLVGDASDDNILKAAKIDTAAGLFATLPTDEENLFLIITAGELNSNMKIISKAVKDTSVKKLISAGASSVVQPNLIGGMRMASEMIRPHVTSFLDKMLKEGKGDLRVDEAVVRISTIKKINDINFKESGALPLAIVTQNGYVFNPDGNTGLKEGDKIIVMGNTSQVSRLKEML